MKKYLALLLSLVLVFSLAACNSAPTAGDNDTPTTSPETSPEASPEATPDEPGAPETVTITTMNGAKETVQLEVPYNPERIAVMDLATLDILDNLGVGGCVAGVSKGSSIDYLQDYVTDESILNLGTIKEANMEAVLECDPQIIFIGGRLASIYDELAAIAPVVYLGTDATIGVVESTRNNATTIASIFGLEDEINAKMAGFDARIQALADFAAGKTAVVGMVNAGGYGVLGNDGRCSIIGVEVGFENVGIDSNIDTSTHGNEASFEFLVDVNPDYIFAMDRDAAIGTEGAQLAAEVLDNELVNMTDAAKNGNVIVLAHSNVWYTAEGGISALDIMLSDLESELLQ